MGKKKSKKRSGPQENRGDAPTRHIPGLSITSNIPSCLREQLPSSTAGGNSREQLHSGTTGGNSREQLSSGTAGGNSREQLPSGTAGGNSREQLPSGTAGGTLREQLPSGTAGGTLREQLPSGTAGGNSREQLPSGTAGRNSREQLPSGTAGGTLREQLPSGTAGGNSREQLPSGTAGGNSKEQLPSGTAGGTLKEQLPSGTAGGNSREHPKPSYVGISDMPGGSKMNVDSCSSREQLPSTSQSEIESSQRFRDMTVMPKKPTQPGKLGQALRLISNCYPLKFSGCNVYHYDIEIIRLGTNYTTPDSGSSTDSIKNKDAHKKYRCLNTKLNRKVFQKLCNEKFINLLPVYDGESNVYCIKKLPVGKSVTFEVRIESENPGDPGDPRGPRMDVFKVNIKPVVKKETNENIINLEPLNLLFRGKTSSVPLEAVMVLETVLRHLPCLRFVPVGRNFFSQPTFKHPLGNGKEIWFGHHQSVRLCQETAVVNLNLSLSSFYENISVIEYIEKLFSGNIHLDQVLKKDDIKKINDDIKNVWVETNHQSYRRKYKVEMLSEKSANNLKFSMTENNEKIETTVEKYYKTRYKKDLRYPHLPCLKVKNKNSFLPMEFCKIVIGQHSNKELNPRQQAEMIKYASKLPRQRFDEITEIHRECGFENDQYLQSFGMRVSKISLKADGRIMETPNVLYKGEYGEIRERPKLGTWNMKNKQFFTGSRISSWALLSFAGENCPHVMLNQFAAALYKFANQQGIEMSECAHIDADARLQSVRPYIQEMKRKYKAQMIFIVLPIDSRQTRAGKLSQTLYSEVKRIAETDIGILTQCVKGENVKKLGTNPSFVGNLCLKMNAKMGGVNNSMIPEEISIQPKEAILFVGADVNHPAPTDDTYYSLAAVVGNLDPHPSRYTVSVRAQKNDKNVKKMIEAILNIKDMMINLLKAYYIANGKVKPKKIIIYRDGVSDGQFYDVQNREIKLIRQACTSLEPEYKPKITFIVVQKRHQVRFLTERKSENPPPGTVIDTTITHPLNFDFFLYSHKGLKGTSRPSYYTVLADDNKFSFDALEKMTYALCYTYVRCTKSISLPAPVQYADLAAYRARRHLNSHLKDLEVKGEIQKEDDKKFNIPIERVQEIIDVVQHMKGSMYYA